MSLNPPYLEILFFFFFFFLSFQFMQGFILMEGFFTGKKANARFPLLFFPPLRKKLLDIG